MKTFIKLVLLLAFSTISFEAVADDFNGYSPETTVSPGGVSGGDITGKYSAALEALNKPFSQQQFNKLQNYKVLLVPGFLTRIELGLNIYFSNYINWFEQSGIDYEIVDMRTGSSMQENGAVIAQAVMDSPKPVILIAHSKGGTDTLEALLNYQQIQAKVKGQE